MAPESWFVLTVAGAFFLLGIAASPLAWVALTQRRSQAERQNDRRFLDLTGQLRRLRDRVERCEASYQSHSHSDALREPAAVTRPRAIRTAASMEWSGPGRGETTPSGPMLIEVPNLASTSSDREATLSGLTQRYAAIWTLADTGASPEVIARATGQPVGQIELILGLRRQIDGARTTIPHARHE